AQIAAGFAAAVVVAQAAACFAAAVPTPPDPLRAALERAHFSLPRDRGGVVLRRVGDIAAGGRRFRIVDYIRSESRRRMRARGGGTPHGAERVLVFLREDGGRLRYLGAYGVDAKPVAVAGAAILFDTSPKLGDRIAFGPRSPPPPD